MHRMLAIPMFCVSITMLGALPLLPHLGRFPVAEASDPGCGAILGPGGHFALDSDVGPCPGVGAAVTLLDGARLYLRGFTISCEASPGSHPVGVLVSGSGAFVHNGTVTGCDIGVKVQGDRSRIALVRTRQIPFGFHVTGDRNVLTSNTADGSFHVSGDGNTLYRNLSEGPDGGVIAYGQGNRILGNLVQYTGTGFLLWGAQIVVLGNYANFNDCIAFEASGDHITFRQNSAYRNGCDGLRLTVDSSDVRRNVADRNFVGLRVSGDDNRILENSAQNNEDFDFIDSSDDCDHNTWRHNVNRPDEQRRSPFCIE